MQEIPHTVHCVCAVRACVHVCAYEITHAHVMCGTCVHEQSMDHISLKRDGPTCYIVIHYAGCVW